MGAVSRLQAVVLDHVGWVLLQIGMGACQILDMEDRQNPSWGYENDQDIDTNEKEHTTTIRNVPKTMKSRSSAQWGKLPPVPPLPSSSWSDPDGPKKKQERPENIPTTIVMTTGG